jgi:pyruvate formate lyase activating enzyme
MAYNPEKNASTKTEAPGIPRPPEGWVFDVKRFAVHDGPGVRTTVFLKGCSLRCVWCHNPESINPYPELLFHPSRCIACGACLEVCPHGAHRMTAGGERTYDRSLCVLCGRCAASCYAEALVMAGQRLSVEDVMAVVRQDATFYTVSGGGVTLSGGEPLFQGAFATALLRQCQAEGFHTAIDTCGHVRWAIVEHALPYIDLVLYDLKHISPTRHQQYTGESNSLILENLRRLSRSGVPIEIRMPIIPTINDDQETIDEAARFLTSLNNITAVRLLAYHRLAGSKYHSLGRENTLPDVAPPSSRQMRQIASWIRHHGLSVIVPETIDTS